MSKEKNKIAYSEAEQKLLTLARKNREVTTDDLIACHYGRKVPINGRKIVVGVMRSLIEKTKKNREKFKIVKSPRKGPVSMTFTVNG